MRHHAVHCHVVRLGRQLINQLASKTRTYLIYVCRLRHTQIAIVVTSTATHSCPSACESYGRNNHHLDLLRRTQHGVLRLLNPEGSRRHLFGTKIVETHIIALDLRHDNSFALCPTRDSLSQGRFIAQWHKGSDRSRRLKTGIALDLGRDLTRRLGALFDRK